jgi:hypothetical protein
VRFQFEAKRSRLTVRTHAEGLLARLAHDLSIVLGGVAGEAEGEGDEEGAPRAKLRVPVEGMRVEGAVRGGAVESLSEADTKEIERRLREDVFQGKGWVGVDGDLERGRVRARVSVEGARTETTMETAVSVTRDGETVTVAGAGAVSLRGLGLREVRGPMGAFRVADRVEVAFEATFVRVP